MYETFLVHQHSHRLASRKLYIFYTLFIFHFSPASSQITLWRLSFTFITFFFFLPNMLNSSTAGNDKAFLTVKIAYCFRVWLIFWGKTSYRLPAPWPLQNALTHSVQMGIFKYKNSLFAGQLLSRCQQSVRPLKRASVISRSYSGVLLHLSRPFNLKTRCPGLHSSKKSRTGLSNVDSVCEPTQLVCVEIFSSSSSICSCVDDTLWQLRARAMRRSRGLRECIHWGRKSQLWSFEGRRWGLWACSTLTMPMKMVTPRKGAPTPVITLQPASERPSTTEGRSKKLKIR